MDSIRQKAFELYKKNLSAKIGYTVTYTFFILIAFILAWFLPETLLLTVPLYIVPFTYGLQLACADVNNGFSYKLKALFIGFRLYYSPNGFGAYSILMGFLKFLGVYIGFQTITAVVATSIYLKIDPQFVDLISQFDFTNMEKFNEVFEQLIQSQTLVNIEFISSSVGMFFGLYMLLHHIMSNSIKADMSFYTPSTITMQNNKVIHKLGFSSFRKKYYKDYYLNTWPMILLYVVGFVGGCLLGYFVFNTSDTVISSYQIQIIGFLFSLLLNLILIPYFFDVMECLYKRHVKDYEKSSINGIMENIEELLKQTDLTEQEKDMLNELKKKKQEDEKQNTDNKKSDD